MDSVMKSHFENLEAKDKSLQLEAFQNIINATKEKVDWAYEVWDQLIGWLPIRITTGERELHSFLLV